MYFKKKTLQSITNEQSEELLTELANLQIPRDLGIVQSWLNKKRYQNVNSMHELVEKVKADPTKSKEDMERITHVLG